MTSAILTTALPALGTQSITATYGGDTDDQGSSTALSVTVGQYQRPLVVIDAGDYSQMTPGDNPIDTNGGISLRSAIAAANADAAVGLADTIIFSSALNGDTLNLTQGQLELEAGSVPVAIEGGAAPNHRQRQQPEQRFLGRFWSDCYHRWLNHPGWQLYFRWRH